MTRERLARRLGPTLIFCGAAVLVIALATAMRGAGAQPLVITLHHLFGLALAAFGAVLVVVGVELGSVDSRPHPTTALTELGDQDLPSGRA